VSFNFNSGNLIVTGSFTFNKPLNVNGTLTVGGNFTINDGGLTTSSSSLITVTGDFTAKKDVISNGTLAIGGNFSINDGFLQTNSGSLTAINGDLYVKGSLSSNGDLVVAGNFDSGKIDNYNHPIYVFGSTSCSGNGCHQINDYVDWTNQVPPPGEDYIINIPPSGDQTLAAVPLTVCLGGTTVLTATFTNPVVCDDIDTVLVNINGSGWTSIPNSFSSTPCQMTTAALNAPGTYLYKFYYYRNNGNKGYSNTVTVTVNTTVTINAFSPATSTRCQGAGTITTTTTANNSTGITYSLDGASISGGNTIVAATGAVSYAAGWSGTTTITASAAGCNGPATTNHVVTITPTVGTPTAITISGGTEPTCQLTNGTTTTTYTTTSTNSTGFNWSLSNDAAGSIGSTTGIMTWANGFSGSVNIQVTANGCNGPSAQVTRAVSVIQSINAFIELVSSSPACPQLAHGFDPDNSNHQLGETEVIFSVTRQNSTTNWSFDYQVTVTNSAVSDDSPNTATGSYSGIDSPVLLNFYINNFVNTPIDVTFNVTNVTDINCNETVTTDNDATFLITAMPALGPFE
jgi:hypothetical protein